MKILFLSDTHLGFGRRHRDYPERAQDALVGFRKALELARREGASLVLHGGDMFDTARPSFDVLHDTVELLSLLPPVRAHVRVESWEGKTLFEKEVERAPLVVVHGNHDWGQSKEKNIYTLLERAGLLFYAHRRRIIVEVNGEELCVVGMGWVPDKYVLDVLRKAPRCEGGIFLFHQPVEGLYPRNPREYLVPPSAFPPGYRYYLGGHLHWVVDKELAGRRFLIPGSTVITRLKDGEMERPRIVYLIDEGVRPLQLEGVRRAYLVEGGDVEAAIERILSRHSGPPPIIKVVADRGSVDEERLRKLYEGRALIYVFERGSDPFYETIRHIRTEVQADAFSRAFVLDLLKEIMGEEWHDWMGVLVERALSGEELDVDSLLQVDRVQRRRSGTLEDWLG